MFCPEADVTGRFGSNIYADKLDKDGNVIWEKKIGGNGFQEARDIVLDALGHLYLTGKFEGNTDFDPGPGTYLLSTLPNEQDGFVLKLDTTGNFIWAKPFSGPGMEWGTAIALDKNAHVYVAGHFRGADSADFNPDAARTYKMKAMPPFDDIYLVKLDTAGAFIWAKQIATGPGINQVTDMIMGATNEAFFLTGTFTDSADFNPGTNTHYLPPGYSGRSL